MTRRTLTAALAVLLGIMAYAGPRERTLINNDWKFALGNAGDMEKDYTHGTEYFTYLTKAAATGQNRGPSWVEFDDSNWRTVNVPFDWVVDLPFSGEASHSHGYKMVGWKYPENSVGWYRKTFTVPESDKGKYIAVRFDGIFRDAEVFINGFYLGHERSGYATQVYDISEYLNYGDKNYLTVRADASTEEGWFYEGAGIYRDVWIIKTDDLHVKEFGTFVRSTIDGLNAEARTASTAKLDIDVTLENLALKAKNYKIVNIIKDADGKEVARTSEQSGSIEGKIRDNVLKSIINISNPHLWDLENPYLYKMVTEVYSDGVKVDEYETTFGIRKAEFVAGKGFFLNGRRVELKGSNLHQDHTGVGSAIPERLFDYRINRMKSIGSNAVRTSHNPVAPVFLDLCDKMGFIVIEENRLMGINDEHIDLLNRMIERDRNHPSIVAWSIGNEEWAIEWDERGLMIMSSMNEYVHRADPTRPATLGNCSGNYALKGVDVKGYNYIIQNKIEENYAEHPEWPAPYGSEETSGCGTRNIYYTDSLAGRMAPLNRTLDVNKVVAGWKFYHERPWLAGLFYWTGLDYRGEPNPMVWPATGSEFGLMDYCGFPKDEAFYLKAMWTEDPVLHLSPHWNLKGHEGETIKIWAYTNCDEVELTVNGKNLGRKTREADGYIEWEAPYKAGKMEAQGWKNGKKYIKTVVETTGEASKIVLTPYNTEFAADGQDIAIVDISLLDSKNREVPDAMDDLTIKVSGPAEILGWGNGDAGFKDVERPVGDTSSMKIKAFAGKAQVILRSIDGRAGEVTFSVDGPAKSEVKLTAK